MDPRAATTLKLALWGLILFFLFIFGSKHYKKYTRKQALVAGMRDTVSDASFYRSLTPEAAKATLLKAIAMVDEAKSLGLEPSAYFDLVFDSKSGKSGLGDEYEEYPARERIAREALLRGYQHAGQFGLTGTPAQRATLAKGELPDGSSKPVIGYIIDPAVSPGMEKLVPNLEFKPAGAAGQVLTDLEIAAAKNLASDLLAADVIESGAEKRIREHYLKRADAAAGAQKTAE